MRYDPRDLATGAEHDRNDAFRLSVRGLPLIGLGLVLSVAHRMLGWVVGGTGLLYALTALGFGIKHHRELKQYQREIERAEFGELDTDADTE